MRMCSLAFRVQDAQSMKTAPKRYHCSSSHAFDEMPKMLRMMALMAETRMATTIAQATDLADAFVEAVDGPAYSQERFHRCFPLTLYQL